MIFDEETFPFDEFASTLRDVPFILVAGDSAFGLDLLGSFDRIAVTSGDRNDTSSGTLEGRDTRIIHLEVSETPEILSSILQKIASPTQLRRGKTVHRVNSSVVESVIGRLFGTGEARPEILEVRRDGLALLAGDGHRVVSPEELRSPTLSESCFDVVVSDGVLQSTTSVDRTASFARMWHLAKPGGRIVSVDEFVFDRATREHMSTPPASVAVYVEDVMQATSGRVTLDLMRSLKYPPDEVHRAAAFAFRRL